MYKYIPSVRLYLHPSPGKYPITAILNTRYSKIPLRPFSNTSNPQTRILDAIKNEHADLNTHSQKILTSIDTDEQTRYQNQFTWELARHIVGEELIVYPAIIQHVSGGQQISNENRIEHQEIKTQLKMFQGLPATDPRFAPTLEGLVHDLQQHMRHEEEKDFVRLEHALEKGESEELTRSLEKTRMFLPSRSHPLAPSAPPFETAVGLLTAPVDLLADLFRKWPRGQTGSGEGRSEQKGL
ncbi:hypothetical protein N7456_008756 [Penicillium angulare]|uniref:Hemerythrin-like domain-containing protein n=1 Tax=Penicillium angulare TaxID=116970 RepID=A0A9W9K4U9_9EURO|nr:hypothetical protein N7456_008756 [Penicillium angulare]